MSLTLALLRRRPDHARAFGIPPGLYLPDVDVDRRVALDGQLPEGMTERRMDVLLAHFGGRAIRA